MAEVFVDTSAWYPLMVGSHPDHPRVRSVLEEAIGVGTRLVTTNLVVAESHALLLHRVGRVQALAFARAMQDPSTIVVSSSAELEHIAIEDWLARYADQTFSFTDAVSYVVMKRRGITRAITLDHHFAAAGFEILPSRDPPPRGRRRRGT